MPKKKYLVTVKEQTDYSYVVEVDEGDDDEIIADLAMDKFLGGGEPHVVDEIHPEVLHWEEWDDE